MGLYGVWNIQKIRGKIVKNSNERAKVIIEGFKKINFRTNGANANQIRNTNR